ncbi:MAG: glycerol-3-phosphate 1-O-acyltransferase PlsY [Oscillospiraceae bacterium]|nr:glycerol-3-phosphate 1-O-acyltransferase PlsY [Ruminococcus sp.]MDD6098430.1 glycerol-3-phosphate 1-O-acyltransferase PlsY [Oscillospiraceae bacterium]
MNYALAIGAAALIGYLLGSCNFSIIVVRLLKGEDVRKNGSGNAGLTNTLRCYGKGCALLTLIGDLGKGVVAVLLARLVCSLLEAGLPPSNDPHYIGYIAGLFAILGHVFPLYYGFKGGKGVLVGVSVFLIVDPAVFGALITIFAVILIISKYVSLSSIISSACCPLATFLGEYFIRNASLQRSLLYTALSLPMAAMVIWMHRSNMQRLRDGCENKFSIKSGKK